MKNKLVLALIASFVLYYFYYIIYIDDGKRKRSLESHKERTVLKDCETCEGDLDKIESFDLQDDVKEENTQNPKLIRVTFTNGKTCEFVGNLPELDMERFTRFRYDEVTKELLDVQQFSKRTDRSTTVPIEPEEEPKK